MQAMMDWCGKSRQTVYRWIKEEGLPYLELGEIRFDPEDVFAWARSRRRSNQTQPVTRPTRQVGAAFEPGALTAAVRGLRQKAG